MNNVNYKGYTISYAYGLYWVNDLKPFDSLRKAKDEIDLWEELDGN